VFGKNLIQRADSPAARNFVQGTQFVGSRRGSKASSHLFNELLVAHESVLNSDRQDGSPMNAQWARDFAAGEVVPSNDAQR
jgi:hypothetical protein